MNGDKLNDSAFLGVPIASIGANAVEPGFPAAQPTSEGFEQGKQDPEEGREI